MIVPGNNMNKPAEWKINVLCCEKVSNKRIFVYDKYFGFIVACILKTPFSLPVRNLLY
jgi:hypothetical protein